MGPTGHTQSFLARFHGKSLWQCRHHAMSLNHSEKDLAVPARPMGAFVGTSIGLDFQTVHPSNLRTLSHERLSFRSKTSSITSRASKDPAEEGEEELFLRSWLGTYFIQS